MCSRRCKPPSPLRSIDYYAPNPAPSGQVITGWPTAPDLTAILAQSGDQYQVTVYDRGTAKNETRYRPVPVQVTALPPPGTAAYVNVPSGSVEITVAAPSGTTAGINFWAFVGTPLHAALYQTKLYDKAPNIATGLAAAINALGAPGVVATPSGGTFLVTGSPQLRCNVAGFGSVLSNEVGRVDRSVQITVWANNPEIRWPLADAIISAVGTVDLPFLTLSDGTGMRVRYATDFMVDTSQSSYSLYEHHYVVTCEYGIVRDTVGYVVGEIETIDQVNDASPTTQVIGG